MKQIVRILPHYEPRIWGGGTCLREEFHYVTDVAPLGEVYNVVCYCHYCLEGLLAGGADAMHIAQLLFPDPETGR